MSDFLNDHVWIIFVYMAIPCIALIFIGKIDTAITAMMHWKRKQSRRDPVRLFTAKQRNIAMQQCKYRCEGTGVFTRCDYTGKNLQGDHWFPHSRGGITSTDNLVMLCPDCNRRKSDTIPTRFQTIALRRRRKRGKDYLDSIPKKVGTWRPYFAHR